MNPSNPINSSNPSNPSNLQIIDPTNFPAWDDLLLATPGHSFFHSSAWARVLKDSYGYTPMYFASIENGKFSALIPVMEVDSFLTGKRGVSLPFTDYCEPIINGSVEFVELFNRLIEYGKKRGWKYIELRGGEKFLSPQSSTLSPVSSSLEPRTLNLEPVSSSLNPESCNLNPDTFSSNLQSSIRIPQSSCLVPRPSSLVPDSVPLAPDALRLAIFPSEKYLGHTLDLTGGEEKILSSFRDSTRRNIKKAIKEGVTAKILNSLESVKEFYRLNCMTRKDHGLPPQPYYFFKNIYEHIVSHNKGFVSLASYQDRYIAGAFFFHFSDKAIYKYGASDKKIQDLRANNLAMWEGIRWFCNNGYKSFCFGRTEPENKGLQQFKDGWGAKERVESYFKYDFRKKEFIKDSLEFKNIYHYVFQKTPAPLLNIIGSSLYKHIG